MFAGLIENLLNRGLPRSPRARALVAQLAGRSVAVQVRGFARYVVHSDGNTLKVTRDAQARADAEISGGPVSLAALGGRSPEAVIQRGDVTISGDAQLAQSFRELAQHLSPDLEEELAVLVGDLPAHQAGRLARAFSAWSGRSAQTAVRNVAEYLAHESRDLVPRAEGEQFLAGVDALREGVDRAAARIEALSQSRPGPDGPR
jgi:ubiquinone biosynthesis protein UbiJ